jgi:predicted nucleotidyltransferase
LYGSRARGDEAPDSDYDVCIVAENHDAELEDQVMELAAQWLDRYDAFISPLIYAETNFDRFRDAGLFREILKEGVRL